ncbi:endoribonuclease YbeY [Flavobacteriaceae bacterium UJ101]|nr:endoribonuclease YbeY [Flavobacteriaceae bacterium UJ101]
MIYFFSENNFVLKNQKTIISWIEKIVSLHQGEIEQINYIFCDDDYLLKINQDFLQHDYYTDIITFDNSIGKKIEGEIFISTDRIEDNSCHFKVSFEEELRRVLIHGILHLLGFKDKTEDQQKQMTQKENEALQLYKP